jgi:hypothetical protein
VFLSIINSLFRGVNHNIILDCDGDDLMLKVNYKNEFESQKFVNNNRVTVFGVHHIIMYFAQ